MRPNSLASITVIGVWAALTFGLFWLVATCGTTIPGPDEWQMVPVLVGKARVTLPWLFSRHAEHCVPLTRGLLLLLARVSASDFRAGMIASVLVLSITALSLIGASRRLRGRLTLADISLPLLLLHFGHRENILQGWNLQNAIFAGMAVAVFIVILGIRDGIRLGNSLSLGALLILLPFTGASGVMVSLVISAWYMVDRLLARDSPVPQERFDATIGAALACASLGIDRLLLGFDGTALLAVMPWLFIIFAMMLWTRLAKRASLRVVATLTALALAGITAWLMRLDEAALEALALLIVSWVALRSLVRFLDDEHRAKLDGLLTIGLSLVAALAIVVFRGPDLECLLMITGCLAVALSVWSLNRIALREGKIGLLAAFVVLAVVTVGANRTSAPPSPSAWVSLRGAVMFLSTGFGLTAGWHWPYSGYAIVFLWLLAIVLLAHAAIRRDKDRAAIVGLMAYWLAFTGLALAAGWGRSGLSENFCLEERYSLLTVAFLCAVYCIIGLCPPRRAGMVGQFMLAGLIVLWSGSNFQNGLREARYVHEKNERFMEDMNAGKPLPYLIYRHNWWGGGAFTVAIYNQLDGGMRLLHDAGNPIFANLRVDLPDTEQAIVFDRYYPQAAVTSAHAELADGSIRIQMNQSKRIHAVLVRFELTPHWTPGSPVAVDIHWPGGPASEIFNLGGSPYDLTAAAWIDKSINQFEVHWPPRGSLRVTRIACLIASPHTAADHRIGNPFFQFR